MDTFASAEDTYQHLLDEFEDRFHQEVGFADGNTKVISTGLWLIHIDLERLGDILLHKLP